MIQQCQIPRTYYLCKYSHIHAFIRKIDVHLKVNVSYEFKMKSSKRRKSCIFKEVIEWAHTYRVGILNKTINVSTKMCTRNSNEFPEGVRTGLITKIQTCFGSGSTATLVKLS